LSFLPRTQIFWSQYLCKLMVQIFDISDLDYFINSLKYLRSTTLGYKDIENRKSKFVAKTELLFYLIFFNLSHSFNFYTFQIYCFRTSYTITRSWFLLNQIQGKKVPNRANVLKLCLCIKNLTKNYKKKVKSSEQKLPTHEKVVF